MCCAVVSSAVSAQISEFTVKEGTWPCSRTRFHDQHMLQLNVWSVSSAVVVSGGGTLREQHAQWGDADQDRTGQNAWFALNYIITGSLVGINGTQYNKHTKTFGAGLILLYRSSLKALQLVSRHMASILCDYCVFAKTFWLLISLDGYKEDWGNKIEGI